MIDDPVNRRTVLVALAMFATPLCAGAAPAPHGGLPAGSRPIDITADDGVVLHGTLTEVPSPRALILLFHQVGSGKGEYATIAPRLAAAGFSSLAIDQRVGGSLFGENETAAAVGGTPSYLDAKRDLVAALKWAETSPAPIVLWGSSYSAALVFLVAAEHPGYVAAVMAFSPAEHLGGGKPVAAAASRIVAPIFVTSARDPDEVASARQLLATAPARIKVQFVPRQGGVHGSSTLIPSLDPRGSEAAWHAVLGFLTANVHRATVREPAPL